MMVGRRLTALAGVLVLLAGCRDQVARDEIAALNGVVAAQKTQLDDAAKTLSQLSLYVGRSPQLVEKPEHSLADWTLRAHLAICSLEKATNPPPAKRLCPAGSNVEHGAPPKPPPFL